MGTWLTYMAALLMAAATAFTFSSSAALATMASALTNTLIEVGTFMFLPLMVVTFAAGTASLKKDRLGGKTLKTTILWAVISTIILSLAAVFFSRFFPQVFPTTSSAGGSYDELFTSYVTKRSPLGLLESVIKVFLPSLFGAWILGAALTPTSDIIRPAYTVMNSFSEAMYRIERTAAFFGGLFIYVAGISFFLHIWQEKTIIVAPTYFVSLFLAAFVLILVVLPILYALFTGFKRNPFGIVGRSIASLLLGFLSSNLYVSSLVNESISRCNLGVQKRMSSTTIPISVIISRGGTAFVSTSVILTLLSTLGAEMSLSSSLMVASACALLSFTSSLYAGYEVLAVTVAALKMLNIESYGSEVALIALLPVLNGIGTMLDALLSNMAASICSVRTKTDAKIPLRDTI